MVPEKEIARGISKDFGLKYIRINDGEEWQKEVLGTLTKERELINEHKFNVMLSLDGERENKVN